ncbi:MAG: hypothetical protein DME05_06525, partial [Candidatus Rokuibacteriota bacterium]
RDTLAGVNRALDDPELRKAPADLRAAIRTALVSRIDALEAARLALGDGWMARTPAEREEFTAVFGDHFERTYIFRIAAHAPMYRPLAIRYLDEKSDGGTATVATTLGNREGGEVPVEYRLIQRDGRWVIYDVVIDGASLIDNYKTLFSRGIGPSSFPDVMALMKPRPSEPRTATPATKAPEPRATAPSSSVAATAEAPTPAPAVETSAPLVATPAPPVATPLAASPTPAAGAPTAPSPATAAPPSVAAPTPLASSPAAVTSSGNSELARLVADHAARAGTTEKPPAPEPTAAYWLQVGAFKNRDVAGGLAARLRARSLPVSVDSVTAPAGTPLTRVRVGPFADQAEAAAKLRELQTSGYRPFLAVERKSN